MDHDLKIIVHQPHDPSSSPPIIIITINHDDHHHQHHHHHNHHHRHRARRYPEHWPLRLKNGKPQVVDNFGYLVSASSRIGIDNLL